MTKIGLVKTAKGVNLRVAVDNGALMVKVSRSVGRSCSMAYYERHMPSKTWCRQRAQLINTTGTKTYYQYLTCFPSLIL